METILDSEYRKEITGKRLKKLREFLLDYHSVTLREEPSGKEQIIELSFPVTWGSGKKEKSPGEKHIRPKKKRSQHAIYLRCTIY